MPPKPWETKNKPPSNNISEIIASSSTQKDDVVKQPPVGSAFQTGISNNTNINGINSTIGAGLGSMNSLGGYGTVGGYGNSYGGYGSSYGGYGSSYGGYGSSYGGMGGYGRYGGGYGSSYGSSYGMGMGGYGMGGYGMGMMGMAGNVPGQQNNFLNHTLMTLERFGYLINILSEIARSFDANYQGLNSFSNSFKKIGNKISSGTSNSIKWVFKKLYQLLKLIFQFIKHNVLFMKKQKSEERYKSVSKVLQIVVIVFAISLYPLLRKGLKVV